MLINQLNLYRNTITINTKEFLTDLMQHIIKWHLTCCQAISYHVWLSVFLLASDSISNSIILSTLTKNLCLGTSYVGCVLSVYLTENFVVYNVLQNIAKLYIIHHEFIKAISTYEIAILVCQQFRDAHCCATVNMSSLPRRCTRIDGSATMEISATIIHSFALTPLHRHWLATKEKQHYIYICRSICLSHSLCIAKQFLTKRTRISFIDTQQTSSNMVSRIFQLWSNRNSGFYSFLFCIGWWYRNKWWWIFRLWSQFLRS
jgi:hypothetical protein